MDYARGIVLRDDCRGLPASERPPLCGTELCECDRARGLCDRWDHAADARVFLDRGWLTMRDLSAPLFADVRDLDAAISDVVAECRSHLETEARAKGVRDVGAYVARGMQGVA